MKSYFFLTLHLSGAHCTKEQHRSAESGSPEREDQKDEMSFADSSHHPKTGSISPSPAVFLLMKSPSAFLHDLTQDSFVRWVFSKSFASWSQCNAHTCEHIWGGRGWLKKTSSFVSSERFLDEEKVVLDLVMPVLLHTNLFPLQIASTMRRVSGTGL